MWAGRLAGWVAACLAMLDDADDADDAGSLLAGLLADLLADLVWPCLGCDVLYSTL